MNVCGGVVVQSWPSVNFGRDAILSSSITQINENSPFLDEIFEGDSWKKVIKNIPSIPKNPKDDKDDASE